LRHQLNGGLLLGAATKKAWGFENDDRSIAAAAPNREDPSDPRHPLRIPEQAEAATLRSGAKEVWLEAHAVVADRNANASFLVGQANFNRASPSMMGGVSDRLSNRPGQFGRHLRAEPASATAVIDPPQARSLNGEQAPTIALGIPDRIRKG
jgi:hypothetical protein